MKRPSRAACFLVGRFTACGLCCDCGRCQTKFIKCRTIEQLDSDRPSCACNGIAALKSGSFDGRVHLCQMPSNPSWRLGKYARHLWFRCASGRPDARNAAEQSPQTTNFCTQVREPFIASSSSSKSCRRLQLVLPESKLSRGIWADYKRCCLYRHLQVGLP